jgi:Universal stress protein family
MTSQPARHHAQHIVVGVDGSEGSRAALRWAAQEAELRDAELEAVMARMPPLPMALFGPGSIPIPTTTAPLDLEARARTSEQASSSSCTRSWRPAAFPADLALRGGPSGRGAAWPERRGRPAGGRRTWRGRLRWPADRVGQRAVRPSRGLLGSGRPGKGVSASSATAPTIGSARRGACGPARPASRSGAAGRACFLVGRSSRRERPPTTIDLVAQTQLLPPEPSDEASERT